MLDTETPRKQLHHKAHRRVVLTLLLFPLIVYKRLLRYSPAISGLLSEYREVAGRSVVPSEGIDLTPTYNGQLKESCRMWLIGYDRGAM